MKDNKDQNIVSSMIVTMLVILVIIASCAGCSTPVPVAVKFPEPPGKGAMERCPDLKKLQEDAKLSGVARTVAENYETYYGCAVKSDTWQEWYQIQKNIFENAGK